MRPEEKKIIRSLEVMEITPHEDITKEELKRHYLMLAKRYHPDTCEEQYKDGKMFYTMKDSYDYLYDHMGLMNEALGHYLHPETDVKEEIHREEEPRPEGTNTQQGFYNTATGTTYVFVDRPSILTIILSLISPIVGFLMYFLHRKRMPKCARTYLACGIIGLGIGVLTLFL